MTGRSAADDDLAIVGGASLALLLVALLGSVAVF